MAPQAQLEESANDRSKPERGGVGTFYSRYKIMQWGLEPSVRNVPNEKKIFQRLTRTVCVCVCGLQIPSFKLVQFLWTDWTAECGSGPENGSSRRRMPGGTPFLSDFFLKSEPYVHRPARKVVRQKKRTSNTENLADLELGRDPVFGS